MCASASPTENKLKKDENDIAAPTTAPDSGACRLMTGPILFLDSGIGGLSVLQEVAALLPRAGLVYCADSAGYPYGTKSEAEISARVPALLGRLVERVQPALIVIACNTASTIALSHVRTVLDVPVVGTVPAIKPAAELSQTHCIGVLGTEATIRQPYVARLGAEFAGNCTILRHGAPGLVSAAETKLRGETPDMAVIRQALDGLLLQPGGDEMDVVVLACTHFPLLKQELQEVAPRPLQFIDGAEGIARRTAHLLQDAVWPEERPEGRAIFTGGTEGLEPLLPVLRRYGLTQVGGL